MAHPSADHMREMEDFKLANHMYRSVWKIEDTAAGNDQSSNKQLDDVRPRTATDHNNSTGVSRNSDNKTKNYAHNKSSSWINDPEVKRQQRIVKYKSYAVEGKMKASLRSGFRWVKTKYCQLVHGY